MELKDFISKTIVDISFGIRDAQKAVYDDVGNVAVAPAFIDGKSVLSEVDNKINFDISVEISQNSKTVGGAKAKVINVVSGNVGSEKSSYSTSTNRIQFSVPFYPQALSNYKKEGDK